MLCHVATALEPYRSFVRTGAAESGPSLPLGGTTAARCRQNAAGEAAGSHLEQGLGLRLQLRSLVESTTSA